MVLQQTFSELFIILLCIDVSIIIVAAVMGPAYPMHTPFNSDLNIGVVQNSPGQYSIQYGASSVLTTPNIYNGTNPSGTLAGNLTTSITNSTGNGIGNFVGFLTQSFQFTLAVLWTFIQFITGGFAFGILAIFGFPAIFIYGIQIVMGFLLVLNIIYLITGR